MLGLYLTLAPFGGNLEGVRAASLAYFGKEPTRLSAAEAALLVAIPRSPERLRPDRHPEAARAARDRVLLRMAEAGVISPATLAEARAETVPRGRLAMPFHAPHLARELRDEEPTALVQRSTIEPLLQRRVEALLKREVSGLDPQASLAAIVVDNRDRRVLAYVGNADFASAARHGTLDMARAVRSPGSALKPFIYAMAFDRLIIHPETVLEDRARHFVDYAPSDFDGRFEGEVTARQALQYSLNLPAVAVLDRLGPGRFIAALAAAGIRLRLPEPAAEPGLAVALGGAGITLVDLVRLYAALSNGGEVAPLRYREDDPVTSGTAIFGPLAAWYVNDILAEAPPPAGRIASRGPPWPQARLQDRDILWLSRFLGDRLRPGSDDRGVGRAARRHADARPQRPADRGAGDVQDRRPYRAGAVAQDRPAASGRSLVGRNDLPPRLRGSIPARKPSLPGARGSSFRRTGRWSNGAARRCRSRRPAGSGRSAGWSTADRCRRDRRAAASIGSPKASASCSSPSSTPRAAAPTARCGSRLRDRAAGAGRRARS